MSTGLEFTDRFARRHIGPDEREIAEMLKELGYSSLDELVDATVPASIRLKRPLKLQAPKSEHELLAELRQIAAKNEVYKSFIGMGYYDTVVPPVILRNVLMNPGWYTQYTPYQAEISQGRLEALLNFQTMISDLTGLEIANASLLDEGTAAAEAMSMVRTLCAEPRNAFFVASDCHPQTIDIVRTRARPLGIEVLVGDPESFDFETSVFGVLVQYPATDGALRDYRRFFEKAHAHDSLVVVAADLLSLALLLPPGELGADVAVGSAQRFGVPMGYGGPHAAFFATRMQYARSMPGRIIGVTEDARGKRALRMALQTREQHIRREKATSNICTAQVLLAVMAGMYAVYHGPKGLKAIAERVHRLACTVAHGLGRMGFKLKHQQYFDTLRIEASRTICDQIVEAAEARRLHLRRIDEQSIGISLDEATTADDLERLFAAFAEVKLRQGARIEVDVENWAKEARGAIPQGLERRSAYLTHPVFNTHHSEHEMLRYIKMLESRDLSLTHSMIPLGSCTMKLNATSEMIPITWERFSRLHPFAPPKVAQGYQIIFKQLEAALAEITGMAGTSLQPNAGSQGEYAGLLVIRRYHESRGQAHRNVALIPQSAHGTNPASAAMAGMKIVVVKTDERGNVDVGDLEARAAEHKNDLAVLMVTYPSTHGVFEEEIQKVCAIVHEYGGQVYMDGANMNAQVGLCRPGDFGADVCHLNLHKTFCIPHGGGGPGMGPICVASHLLPFLPTHPLVKVGGEQGIGAISAAPYGSANILLISWVYIQLMGAEGLTQATKVALLNANYLARKLDAHYPVLYRGKRGNVAHECIVDPRAFKKSAGVEVEDIAKRLMDYGFHAPTISFPVAGTLMIEPTESESKAELDRFVEAMIAIRQEIREIEQGQLPRDDNPLKNAPHTADVCAADEWKHPYGRSRAAFPSAHTRQNKFWPSVARVNNVLGDRHLVCSCPPIEAYTA